MTSEVKLLKPLESLVKKCHEGLSKERIEDAAEIARLTRSLLIEERLMEEEDVNVSTHSQMILTGALLHNCGATREEIKENICMLLANRVKIKKAFKECVEEDKENEIPVDYIDLICSITESQFGKSSEISSLIPNSGHPGYYVSLACGLHYKKKLKEDNLLITNNITGESFKMFTESIEEIEAILGDNFSYEEI